MNSPVFDCRRRDLMAHAASSGMPGISSSRWRGLFVTFAAILAGATFIAFGGSWSFTVGVGAFIVTLPGTVLYFRDYRDYLRQTRGRV